MQAQPKRAFRMTSLMLVGMILMFAMLLSLNSFSAYAQDNAPTATPTDPLWLGFAAARNAIEESTGRNLRFVKSWTFQQESWDHPHPLREDHAQGIDSCDSTVSIYDARPIYFGLTYRIVDLQGNKYEVRVSFDLQTVVICDLLTDTATPAPEGTSEPGPGGENLPAPVAGAGATGSFELGGQITGLTADAISKMNSTGMKWVKQQLPMSAGVGAAQGAINAAHTNGFKILLSVVGDKDSLGSDFGGHVAAYASFVGQVAGAGADAIEVWNEANIDREWPSGQINGGTYTQLLAAAFNAIKSANSNTIVVSGAPAPTGFFGGGCAAGGCDDDVFMQQMAQAGAASYMDCVGLHYNEGIVSPDTNSGDPRGEYPTYYFSSMLNRGYSPFGGKPVCFTELGYLSPEGMGSPLPGAFGWAANTSVAEQASWLAGAAARAAQSGEVRLMIVWNVNFTIWGSDPQGGYAIIRPDGSCPACGTLATVMHGG